jgi:hypothetical protein
MQCLSIEFRGKTIPIQNRATPKISDLSGIDKLRAVPLYRLRIAEVRSYLVGLPGFKPGVGR